MFDLLREHLAHELLSEHNEDLYTRQAGKRMYGNEKWTRRQREKRGKETLIQVVTRPFGPTKTIKMGQGSHETFNSVFSSCKHAGVPCQVPRRIRENWHMTLFLTIDRRSVEQRNMNATQSNSLTHAVWNTILPPAHLKSQNSLINMLYGMSCGFRGRGWCRTTSWQGAVNSWSLLVAWQVRLPC